MTPDPSLQTLKARAEQWLRTTPDITADHEGWDLVRDLLAALDARAVSPVKEHDEQVTRVDEHTAMPPERATAASNEAAPTTPMQEVSCACGHSAWMHVWGAASESGGFLASCCGRGCCCQRFSISARAAFIGGHLDAGHTVTKDDVVVQCSCGASYQVGG